jgi:hypothetical protein
VLAVLAAFAAGAAVFGILGKAGLLDDLLGGTRTTRSVVEVLKTEDLTFLVTTRVTTLICVELRESNLILGDREGLLLATVDIYYGIDLEKLTDDSVTVTDSLTTVRIPEPGILDLSPDLATLRFFDKRSGLVAVSDILTGYDQDLELLAMLDSTARIYATEQGLLPTRDAILARLNGFAPMLAGYIGAPEVRFE